jgi:hypothetical protein
MLTVDPKVWTDVEAVAKFERNLNVSLVPMRPPRLLNRGPNPHVGIKELDVLCHRDVLVVTKGKTDGGIVVRLVEHHHCAPREMAVCIWF